MVQNLNLFLHKFYIEIALVIISILLSLILTAISEGFIKSKLENLSFIKNASSIIKNSFRELIFSLLLFLFTAISAAICLSLTLDDSIVLLVAKLSLFLFVLEMLSILSGSKLSNFIIFLLIAVIFLDAFGLLAPMQKYLGKISIAFGSVKISLYTIIKGCFLTLILFWFSKVISTIGRKSILRLRDTPSNTKGILVKFFDIIIYLIVFIVFLNLVGIDSKTLTIVGSAVGIGIGFGLQKITSNFISGIILLLDKSIEIDDLIECGGPENKGVVRYLGMRYTVIETGENKEIIIPNEDLITSKVFNWTYSNRKTRISISINISYEANLQLAKKLILEAAIENPEVSRSRDPECYLNEFKDIGISLILYFWFDDVMSNHQSTKSAVMMSIQQKFYDNGIKIPISAATYAK